ncbi:class I SAM-dependent methyltransferase [Streptomyces sp. A7024]|uniref:Class I SAM-dependent methyltransferase n=1 Tax=Streptomyces coryli TaxID=1128680 RepID=A0A6G4TZ40_9ACTN|nr:class I SAM-dependent methyltransferase [Streptomyces coryli]NGN65093.1 class I SAM-dependent methyltransferase [Streptomyces coryli]
MKTSIEAQRKASDELVGDGYDFGYHVTADPLVRYLRDRRLKAGLEQLRRRGALDPANQSVLVVCGGAGGEGIMLRREGFADVTVSDLSPATLEVCRELDPELKTRCLNAEAMAELADGSFDLVVVQDGLHHLPRPALGFTEMLRVARTAVILIEPHESLVGRLIGTEWEVQGTAVNYVFRWNGSFLKQVTLSYLLRDRATVLPRRLWDHNLAVGKLVRRCVPGRWRLPAAKAVYAALTPFNRLGNMMVGVVLLHDPSAAGSKLPAARTTG